MRTLIGFLLFFSGSVLAAESFIGHYTAVTESEYLINLKIQEGGHAVFDFKIVATDEDEKDWHQTIAGAWSINGSRLQINLGNAGLVVYKIDPCLSFEEFGFKGCGFGLKAVETTTKNTLHLDRYGLWKNDVLPSAAKPK